MLDTVSPPHGKPFGASASVHALHGGRPAVAEPHARLTVERPVDGYRYLLVFRFVLLNLVGFALLAAAYHHGLVDQVVAADGTYLSVMIFGVFLCGLAICGWKVWQTSEELNRVRTHRPGGTWHALPSQWDGEGESLSVRASTIRLKLSHRIGIVRHIADTLVLLGLIGTVIGFIIALSGVDPDGASDVRSVTPMITTLIEGMSTALYTTLVGAVLYVWLMAAYRMLATGTVKLITALVAFGEARGRA